MGVAERDSDVQTRDTRLPGLQRHTADPNAKQCQAQRQLADWILHENGDNTAPVDIGVDDAPRAVLDGGAQHSVSDDAVLHDNGRSLGLHARMQQDSVKPIVHGILPGLSKKAGQLTPNKLKHHPG